MSRIWIKKSNLIPRYVLTCSELSNSKNNPSREDFPTNNHHLSFQKLIWLENPTNPLMNVIDIGKISQYVKSKNSNIIIVVDNTYSTPYFQVNIIISKSVCQVLLFLFDSSYIFCFRHEKKPLTLGADISMHSLSKYINGHTDVVMGAAITNNETIYKSLKLIQKGKYF